jgi:hypothetical protein
MIAQTQKRVQVTEPASIRYDNGGRDKVVLWGIHPPDGKTGRVQSLCIEWVIIATTPADEHIEFLIPFQYEWI